MMLIGGIFAQCGQSGFRSLSANEFEQAIKSSNIVVLDSRTAREYSDGHIRNAVNIDVNGSDFERKALATLSKSKTIAVYCRSGRRSKKAAEILSNNGYNVIELDCGILCWASSGKEIVK